jgi:hypothetical protein
MTVRKPTPGYRNNGRDWQPEGQPIRVGTHDFPNADFPKAVPYGIYDLAANTGWVTVGSDGDTGAFAVATLRRWWTQVGQPTYPNAKRLMITADAGGSNGYRLRLWKHELAQLATDIGVTITVCHYPPGTSKWNKIEHRLFSAITSNWRGRPLTSPRGHHRTHRSDHHQDRAHRPRRGRQQHLPPRHQNQRRPNARHQGTVQAR